MKTQLHYLLILLTGIGFSVSFSSCQSAHTQTDDSNPRYCYPDYAKGFRTIQHANYKTVEVMDPWAKNQIMARYHFYPKGNKPDADLSDGYEIATPINSMACIFTTHLSYAARLGLTDYISGISEITYVKNEKIRAGVTDGSIIQLGPTENLNNEKLIALQPDVLFVSPFKDNKYGQIEASGIPLAITTGYMENTPLARAEWIKFMSCFFNKEKAADQLFDSIASNYLSLCARTKNVLNQPTVFSGKPYGDVWYISGNKSYMAKYFADAGAQYVWTDKQYTGSQPLDMEAVYFRVIDADYWFILEYYQGDYTYQNLLNEQEAFADIAAFKERNVFLCNTFKTAYYETGLMEPDIILADMIHIFHPELLPDYQPRYFKPILH